MLMNVNHDYFTHSLERFLLKSVQGYFMAIVRSLTLTITLCLAWLTATAVAQDTSLFVAARSGTPQQIQATIGAGFDVSARDQYGQTPLMYAAASNTDPNAVSVLVNAGANVNASTPAGWTALMFAARDNPNRAVAARLFELGADLDARNNEGMRAEDYAVNRSSFNASNATSGMNTVSTANSNMNPGMNMNTGMAGTVMTNTGLTQLPNSFSRQRAINYYSPTGSMNTTGMGMTGMNTPMVPATSMSAAAAASWQNPATNNRAYTMASNLPSRRMTSAPTQITIPNQFGQFGQAFQPGQPVNYYAPAHQAFAGSNMGANSMGLTNVSSSGSGQYYGTRLSDSFAGNYTPNNVIFGSQPVTTLRNINQPMQAQAMQRPMSGGSGVIMTSTGMQNINQMNGINQNMINPSFNSQGFNNQGFVSQNFNSQGFATPLFDIPADNGVQPPARAPSRLPTESTPLPGQLPSRIQRSQNQQQNQQRLTQPSRLLYGPNAGIAAQTFFYQPYALTYTADYGRQYNQSTPVIAQLAPEDLSPCVNINRAAAPALLQIVHINTAAQVADITVERGFQLFSSLEELPARVAGIGPAQLADIRAQGLACIIFE